MAPEVTVMVPLYGAFDIERVKFSVDSIKTQKRVEVEISVVEQSDHPRLLRLEGITYTHIKPVLSSEGFLVPGRVRNLAARNSKGHFLYNNDGDIVFKDTHYLTNLIKKMEEAEDICLYHPLMRRLPLENFKDFKERFDKGGIQRAVNDLDLSQPYGATYSDNFVMIRHFKKNINGELEISVATQKDHEEYHNGNNKGKEPFYYTLNVHAGCTLMRRDQFEAVGGFCEDFAGWGGHDVDLQYKLKRLFNLKKIWQISNLEVLHLDHVREYFSRNQWNKNKNLLLKRQNLPLNEVVEGDRVKYHERRT